MKRNKFSLSNFKLMTGNMGNLYPVNYYEVLPGDTVQQSTSFFMRFTPMVKPTMHPVHCRIHHFFVPYRLIWEDWEDFITGGPENSEGPVLPFYNLNFKLAPGTLPDYLGVPPADYTAHPFQFSMLPARAYALIYNEWFRDEDIQNKVTLQTFSGNDQSTNVELLNVAWEKDYFTSLRPWPQKGPAATIPITSAPTVSAVGPLVGSNPLDLTSTDTPSKQGRIVTGAAAGDKAPLYLENDSDVPANQTGFKFPQSEVIASVPTNQFSGTINDLRASFAVQRFAEARAQYGSRYVEYLRYLGVRSSDARLQRPEYLGGGKDTLQFSEVLQTAPASDSEVGDLTGHGIGSMKTKRYRRFFNEHGLVLSLMSVRPITIYGQAMPRFLLKKSQTDFFQREFQHIGEQEVNNKELSPSSNTATFGYQDRYDEYRSAVSTTAGQFRPGGSEVNWTLMRDFTTAPVLNSGFITCYPSNRIFADKNVDQFQCMVRHSIQARRAISKTGRPGRL